MERKPYMQHFSAQDATFLRERNFVVLRAGEQQEDVTGVLRNSKEKVSTNPTLISTEHLGQSVLTVSTVNKLKRSKKQTLLELERLLKPSMVFGTHAYSIYHTMIQYEFLPLWTHYITYT